MSTFPFPELNDDQYAEYMIFPTNLTRMLLHTKGLTLPYLKFAWSFRNGSLQHDLRERVIVRVGALTHCDYEIMQHRLEAVRTGTPASVLSDLLDPDCRWFDDPALTAVVSYVDSLVGHLGATPETLDEVRHFYSESEVAEITLLAGTYLLCATFVNSLGVTIDENPADWTAADSNLGRLRV